MRTTTRMLVFGCLFALMVAALFGTRALAATGAADIEPNDSCAAAQYLGAAELPVTVSGELAGRPSGNVYPGPDELPNYDFFRVTATPGSLLQIKVSGLLSAQGALENPYLVVFTGECESYSVQFFDGTTAGFDEQVTVSVEGDSPVTIGVTSCCEYGRYGSLLGGVAGGSYTLTINETQPVTSLGGRLLNSETAQPVRDATITLLTCRLFMCYQAAVATSDPLGEFLITQGFNGQPLFPGRYQLTVDAAGYEPYSTTLEDLPAGGSLDLGNVSLVSLPTVRSISGRIIDAATGRPLDAQTLQGASVTLYRCDVFGCFDYYGNVTPDAEGRFSFTQAQIGRQLLAGSYNISVFAPQYFTPSLENISAGRNQDVDVGDIAITSFPVRFGDIQGCDSIPADGGTCRYSVRVYNGQATTLDGQAWSLVNAFGFGPQGGGSTFQNGPAERIRLRPGRSAQLSFRLKLPANVPPGAAFCAYAYVGDEPRAQFRTVGSSFLLCASRSFDGSLQQLSPEQSLEMIQRMNGLPAGRSAPR